MNAEKEKLYQETIELMCEYRWTMDIPIQHEIWDEVEELLAKLEKLKKGKKHNAKLN